MPTGSPQSTPACDARAVGRGTINLFFRSLPLDIRLELPDPDRDHDALLFHARSSSKVGIEPYHPEAVCRGAENPRAQGHHGWRRPREAVERRRH